MNGQTSEAELGSEGVAGRPTATPLGVIEEWLGPLAGRQLLDVGCGRGALARALTERGAQVTGIDPSAAALEDARVALPGATFMEATAEKLPFPSAAFDGVVLLNSLHHVPLDAMEAALAEGARVSRGALLVVEPLAEGPFFEAMRPVEDETAIRHAAQDAIARFVASGAAEKVKSIDFEDERRYPDVDAFLAKIVAVDPARAEAAARLRPEVEALMGKWGTPEAKGLRLNQPHRAVLLRLASAAS